MAKEIKSKGQKLETTIAPSLHKKFRAKVRKNNTSMAQVIRDAVQAYTKS